MLFRSTSATSRAPRAPRVFCVLQKYYFCTTRRQVERQELQECFAYYRSITFVLPSDKSSAKNSKNVLCTTELLLLYYQAASRAPRAPRVFCVLQKYYFCTTTRQVQHQELQECFVYYRSITFVLPDDMTKVKPSMTVSCLP